MMKRMKRIDRFFLILIGSFMIWLLGPLASIYLDELADWENQKYRDGKKYYTEEEVKEYFEANKEEFYIREEKKYDVSITFWSRKIR